MTDVAFLSVAELVALYRRRALSPLEVANALLERINRLDPELNFMAWRDAQTTLAMARESTGRWLEGRPRGLLEGVPVTIKDLVTTRGWPTLRGSWTVDCAQAWEESAPAVLRLREHGAVLLGKTTVSEFGWKGAADSPRTGITRNPWDKALTSGASSAGAAVAAAVGIGPLHIGSDGAGSIRIPAAFTGVFGFKPTYGRVPAHPPSSIGSLANVGPMTRNVADAAVMLTVIGEADGRFWLGVPDHGRDFRSGLESGVRGLRIGFLPTLAGVEVDAEVDGLVRQAMRVFEGLGATVEEIEPTIPPPLAVFRILFYGRLALSIGASLAEGQKALLDPGLRRVIEQHGDHDTRAWLAADMKRAELGRLVTALFQQHDLIVMPQMPSPAFAAGHEVPPGSRSTDWLEWSPFTYLFNMTMHPAAAMPCGLTSAGLPVAMQVVGPRFCDHRVLSACHAFEGARPIARPLAFP